MMYRTQLSALAFLLLTTTCVVAQSDEAREALLQGKAQLAEAASMQDVAAFAEARALFERIAQDPGAAALAHYYAGYASYLIGMTYPHDQRSEPIEIAVAHFEQAVELDDAFADAYAMLDRCYGLQISMDPMLGESLGHQGDMMMIKARSLEPDNPRLPLIEAYGSYWTPEQWGGSKTQALELFRKAAQQFEEQAGNDPVLPDWGEAEAYAWIGRLHLEFGAPDKAKVALDKALKLDPDYQLVLTTLLPNAEKQLAGNDD